MKDSCGTGGPGPFWEGRPIPVNRGEGRGGGTKQRGYDKRKGTKNLSRIKGIEHKKKKTEKKAGGTSVGGKAYLELNCGGQATKVEGDALRNIQTKKN